MSADGSHSPSKDKDTLFDQPSLPPSLPFSLWDWNIHFLCVLSPGTSLWLHLSKQQQCGFVMFRHNKRMVSFKQDMDEVAIESLLSTLSFIMLITCTSQLKQRRMSLHQLYRQLFGTSASTKSSPFYILRMWGAVTKLDLLQMKMTV